MIFKAGAKPEVMYIEPLFFGLHTTVSMCVVYAMHLFPPGDWYIYNTYPQRYSKYF